VRLPLLPRELHTSERPSSTAQWTTLGRALELSRPREQRIVSDDYAPWFLSRASIAVLRGLQTAGPLVRAAERVELGALSTFALCRHRFMDEHMAAALDAGAQQVLVLGAGYDSRAWRFAFGLEERPVYEVDLPPISRRKAEIVAAHPEIFGHTAPFRIEIDFRTESLGERLAEEGFTAGLPTYVVWEGVTPYLTSDAVSATLETLATVCGAGSRIAFDLWRGSRGGQPFDPFRAVAARAFRLIGEPVTFGLPPERVDGLLGAHGFTVIDLVQAGELAGRYSTDGRPVEGGLYVVAATLRD
jgi:methyltransferase (TIGR00027 family)